MRAPLLVACLLAGCASHPRATSSEASGGAVATGDPVVTADAGAVRPCLDDPREQDVTPCVQECDRGIASACSVLAMRTARGDGVARDPTRAVALHERACELRDAASCVTAARMHATGLGVSPNRARQMELLTLACDLGDAAACSVPARAYAFGAGVARDGRRARALWERACTGGVESACEALGDAGP